MLARLAEDGAQIVTDNQLLAQKIETLRNYGSKEKYYNEQIGMNSRLDELQAALLNVKLNHIEELTKERQGIADEYLKNIKNRKILLPKLKHGREGHVFHLFVVQTDDRKAFQEYLMNNGIKSQIHYPVPPFLAECYRDMGYVPGSFPVAEAQADTIISLPLYNGMTREEIEYVIRVVNAY